MPHRPTQNAHVLKHSPHDNFSQDPPLALISPSTRSAKSSELADLLIQCLKQKNLKKSLSLFSPEVFSHNPSRHLQRHTDTIIAMTEKPGGWILRGSSGKNYAAQACLIMTDLTQSLRQSDTLLLQNLDNHRYLVPDLNNLNNLNPNQSGLILLNPNHSAISDVPRISEKLFLINHTQNSENSAQLKTILLDIIQALWG